MLQLWNKIWLLFFFDATIIHFYNPAVSVIQETPDYF